MPHASAEAPANNCTPDIAPVPQLDRRPWVVRVRAACRGPTCRLARVPWACASPPISTSPAHGRYHARPFPPSWTSTNAYPHALPATAESREHYRGSFAGGSDGRSWSRYSDRFGHRQDGTRTTHRTGNRGDRYAPGRGGVLDPPIVVLLRIRIRI